MPRNPGARPDVDLGGAPIGRLLFKMSLPATVAMFFNGLYNLVDTIYIGRGVGTEAIGGLAIAFPAQMIVMAFGMSIGQGAASVVSRSLGAKNAPRARRAAGNAFALSLVCGLMVLVFGTVFMEPLLRLLGATPALAPHARAYLRVILLGSPFIALAMTANNLIRAEGRAAISMTVMLIGALTNIVLDPIFIFALDLGVAGAAWATVTGQFLAFLFASWFFVSRRSAVVVRAKHWKPEGSVIREILSLGIATFVRQSGRGIVSVLLNNLLGRYGGDIYVSAYGVVNRLLFFLFMPLFGTIQGFQPVAGFNYGARQFDRVRKTLRLTITYSTVYTTVGFVLLMALPRVFAGIFSADPLLIETAARTIRFIVAVFPLLGVQFIGAAYFLVAGKAIPSFILNLSRQFLILIPLLLILPPFFGVTGILVSFPAADLLATFITVAWMSRELGELRKLEAAGPAPPVESA